LIYSCQIRRTEIHLVSRSSIFYEYLFVRKCYGLLFSTRFKMLLRYQPINWTICFFVILLFRPHVPTLNRVHFRWFYILNCLLNLHTICVKRKKIWYKNVRTKIIDVSIFWVMDRWMEWYGINHLCTKLIDVWIDKVSLFKTDEWNRNKKSGWEFTKLLTQILNILLNFGP